MDIIVNGVPLHPRRIIADDDLKRADLAPIPRWRCFLRRLPGGFRYWEASDPHIVCFDGKLDIFACRDSYLDPDRKWSTALMLRMRDSLVQELSIRIIDGVYAAGNYYSSFYDIITERIGKPLRNGRRQAAWETNRIQIEATLSPDALDALFRLAWQPEHQSIAMDAERPAEKVSARSRP
jgi:hypothetical protein